MKIETHLLLYLREVIDNWKYIDGIIFLLILLMYVGFTDPCERCMVNSPHSSELITCKQAFNIRIGLDDRQIADLIEKINITHTNINNIPLLSY